MWIRSQKMIVFKSLIHEMDLTAMEQRRRVVRNVDDQIMTSYRDLFNPCPARRQTRRTPNLTHIETEPEAERNCPKFDHTTEDTGQVLELLVIVLPRLGVAFLESMSMILKGPYTQ